MPCSDTAAVRTESTLFDHRLSMILSATVIPLRAGPLRLCENPPSPSKRRMKPEELLTHANTTVIFLVAVAVEGGLFVVALILGAVLDVNPTARLAGAHWSSVAWGAAAGLPPALAVMLALHRRSEFAWRLLEGAREPIKGLLQLAPWQLAVLAMVSGLTEEALFRGVLQIATTDALSAWLNHPSADVCGIGVGALLFGFAHPVSRAYVVVGALFGVWMGVLLLLDGNLLAPMVAHAAYDLMLMLYLKRTW